MKAGADFQQRGDAAAQDGAAGCRLGNAGEDLEQGGLAGAVGSDDAHNFAGRDGEGNVPESPEDFGSRRGRGRGPAGEAFPTARDFVPQRGCSDRAQPIALGEILDFDDGPAHAGGIASVLRPVRANACREICSPIASEDVAPGLGAFNTCRARGRSRM